MTLEYLDLTVLKTGVTKRGFIEESYINGFLKARNHRDLDIWYYDKALVVSDTTGRRTALIAIAAAFKNGNLTF